MDNGYNPQQQQPPQYNYQRPPSLISRIYGRKGDTLQTILTYLSLIFFILAPVALLYYFIMAIIDASAYAGTFRTFISGFSVGVSTALGYLFYGAVLAGIKRIISK